MDLITLLIRDWLMHMLSIVNNTRSYLARVRNPFALLSQIDEGVMSVEGSRTVSGYVLSNRRRSSRQVYKGYIVSDRLLSQFSL